MSEESELGSLARSRPPHSLVLRAQIVLACAEGVPGSTVARRLGVTRPWASGESAIVNMESPDYTMNCVPDAPARRMNVLRKSSTRPCKPNLPIVRERAFHGGTHGSRHGPAVVRSVRRSPAAISNDPFFVEKVRDIVGLYLNPPDHAVVLSVDEKTQVQALQRTQPVLPMGLGYGRRHP